jgi:predicted dehydrogenase
LITASSSSDEIVGQAARSCAQRGKVVLVGVVGLRLNRADFYRREVMFQVSCSYGARDARSPNSAQGNFRQILSWMAEGRLPVADLITHRGTFATAPATYAALDDPRALGILLEYENRPAREVLARTIELSSPPHAVPAVAVAVIGAGNFATRTLLPALVRQVVPVELASIVSARGLSAMEAARSFAAAQATTEEGPVLSSSKTAAVFITTRHDAHAAQTLAALAAGKHVWVEKPLALDEGEVGTLATAARAAGRILMVGFNRRFSPLATGMRRALAGRTGPFRIDAVINAGRIDGDHWTLDPQVGGGRIVGEACHFVDLLRYLAGAPITAAHCTRRDTDGQDGGSFELTFADGSSGLIDYRTDLPPHIPKERITASGPGFSLCIHNWTKLTSRGLRGRGQGTAWLSIPRKGHPEAVRAFLEAVRRGGAAPIPLEEIVEVSRWAIRLQAMVDGQRAIIEN